MRLILSIAPVNGQDQRHAVMRRVEEVVPAGVSVEALKSLPFILLDIPPACNADEIRLKILSLEGVENVVDDFDLEATPSETELGPYPCDDG